MGKVLSYTAESSVPPIGAHMSIQTVYGPVDVHLGSAKLLEQKGFTLNVGDSVRVTGEVISFGQSSTFAARIVEDGEQSVTVRNTKGQLILMHASACAERCAMKRLLACFRGMRARLGYRLQRGRFQHGSHAATSESASTTPVSRALTFSL